MRKIGFYFQMPRGGIMTGEGMTRVHTNAIHGLLSQNFQVFLAFPYWHKQQIKDYFSKHNIISENLKYITYKSLFSPNFQALFSSPFLLASIMPLRIWTYTTRRLPRTVNNILNRLKINNIFNKIELKYIHKKTTLLNEIHDKYFIRLINHINRKKITDTWIIDMFPSSFGYQLNKNLYVFIADCVYVDFPVLYARLDSPWLNNFINNKELGLRKNLHKIKKTISFNDDVRQRHVVNYLGVPSENAHVIKHAPIRHDDILAKINFDRELAIDTTIANFIKQNPHRLNIKWLANRETPYFIYSSQERIHKNLTNLISAYSIVLRNYNISCKLVLTTDDTIVTQLNQHIKNLKLDLDVVRLHRIDNNLLAALYANAHCAINSSLFEGGFPYTFSEALSVETPCIMSNTACVREEITSEDMQSMMLFDPESVQSIVNAMLMTFSQRQLLLEKQQLIFDKMKQRTDKDVAIEYANLFLKDN